MTIIGKPTIANWVRLGLLVSTFAYLAIGSGLPATYTLASILLYGFSLFAVALLFSPHPFTQTHSGTISAIDTLFVSSLLAVTPSPILLLLAPVLWFAQTHSLELQQRRLTAIGLATGLFLAWLPAQWHLEGLYQLVGVLFAGAVVVFNSLQRPLKRHQAPNKQDTPPPLSTRVSTQPTEVLVEDEEPESITQKQLLILKGRTDQAPELHQQLSGWGARIAVEETLPAWLAAASEGCPGQADFLIADLRGHALNAHGLQQLLSDEDLFAKIPCILLLDKLASETQRQQLLHAGYHAVFETPLDPTLLFNAIHPTQTPTQGSVVSLFDRYIEHNKRSLMPALDILLAVDSQIQLKLLRGMLERDAHKIYITRSGEQTLDILNTHQFDVALIDISLKDLDGIELTRLFRLTHAHHSSTPVILLSHSPDRLTEEEALQFGADALLQLPFNTESLHHSLKTVTAARQNAPKQTTLSVSEAVAIPNVEVLNPSILKDLEILGNGLPFVENLIESFVFDSKELRDAIEQSVSHNDYDTFLDCVHALRGSAGSVGAIQLQQQCKQITNISARDFAYLGKMELDLLDEGLVTAHEALLTYLLKRQGQVSST